MRRIAVLALVVAGLAAGGHLLGLARYTTLAGMRALVDAYGAWGPAAFVAVSVAGVLFHLPELVFVALGGALFGPARGFAYGWTACMLGATASFLLARYVLQDVVQRGLEGRAAWLGRLDERLARHGFRTVLVLRVLLCMAPPLNWALGVTRVGFRQYLAASALGVLPGISLAVYSADRVAQAGAGESVLAPEKAAPVLLAAAALTAAAIVGRRLARAQPRA
ncbi:MAG TPA: VTT domain-containing protein [Candidatus Binatia bacterium]|nr:VTT domain-containing protein [Candidatus Binatia bacterium]